MASSQPKTVTLVLGGARSGKSRYAQEIASAFGKVILIATARGDDAEMRAKIAHHRRDRPSSWKTLEVSSGLDRALRERCDGANILIIDCLTTYVATAMGRKPGERRQLHSHLESICAAIQESEASMIIVSNEVGSGVVPPYRSGREYRDLLGEFNQQVARIADRVVLVVAGVPMTIKGRSPAVTSREGRGKG